MYSLDAAAYKSADRDGSHVAHAATETFYSVALGKKKVDTDQLEVFLKNIKHRISEERIINLDNFEHIIDEELNQIAAQDVSFAGICVIDDVMYAVTRGKGHLYLFRGGLLQKLISDNTIASGHIQQADSFILTTEDFFEEVDEDRLTTILSDNVPSKLVEILSPELKKVGDESLVAYFVRVQQKTQEVIIKDYGIQETHTEEEIQSFAPRVSEDGLGRFDEPDDFDEMGSVSNVPERRFEMPGMGGMSGMAAKFKLPPFRLPDMASSSRGRKVTIAVTAVLLLVFLWSVVLGNSRRQKNNFIEEVAKADQTINAKLTEAEDIRMEDPMKALQLVDEADGVYKGLAQKAEAKKYTDIEGLATIAENIKVARQDIQKTEQSPSEEYYDLSLIKSGTESENMYLDDGQLALLDSKNGKVHVLGVSDKSVDTVSSKDMRGAQFVALHQGNPIVFKESFGVLRVVDGEIEKVIDKDKDWKNVRDMWLYNGNIYLLAEGSDEIYKYLVAENGYGEKTSYFKTGQAEDLSGALAMTIDSALYITKGESVLKYVSGLKEAFDVVVPEQKSQFDDIYTSAALENIYVMDKKHATIFIFSKDGEFQKQVASAVIAKASDFVVDEEEGILVLANNKIYQVKQNN